MSAKRTDTELTRLWELLGDATVPSDHPPLSELATLTVSRRFAAGREIAQVQLQAGTWHVTRHQTDGSGWTTAEEHGAGGLDEALASAPDLITLTMDAPGHWVTNEGELSTHDLLAQLRMAEVAAYESPDNEVEDDDDWSDEDETIEALFGNANWRPVRGRINGERVTAVGINADDVETVVPVLVDTDEGELDPIEDIATTSWFSESGGAPISWDGGNSLSRLNGRLGYARQWGDYGAEHAFRVLPDSPEQLAQTVAEWILACDAAVAAALALEPLDPDLSLTADDRERWEELLAAPEIDLTLELADTTVDLVQASLNQDWLYGATAEALRIPDGAMGLALRSALEDVEETGVLGQLVSGQWAVEARSPVPADHVLSDGRSVPLLREADATANDRARAAMVDQWLAKGFGVAVYGNLLLSYGGEGAFLTGAAPPENAPGYLSGGDCPPLRGVIPPTGAMDPDGDDP